MRKSYTCPAAGNYHSIAIGDVTGDGKPDVVGVSQTTKQVSMHTACHDEPFLSPLQHFAAGSEPWGIALGDLNGDAYLDLVVVNNAAEMGLSVLLNDGNGSFSAPYTLAGAPYNRAVLLTDLNGDGKLDIVTANHAPRNLSVLLNATP